MTDPNIVLWDEIDVVSPLRQKTIEEYQRRNPSALEWSEEKLKRLVIRTETRWARTLVDDSVFVVNSVGRSWEGDVSKAPNNARPDPGPMGDNDRIHVNLYALMRPSETDQGFAEQAPFCSVSLTRDQVRRLPVKERDGQPMQVQLADFLADRLPNRAACIRELNTLIATHKQLALSRRSAQAAKQTQQTNEVEINAASKNRSQSRD